MNCFVTRHALWIVMRHIRCELLRGFHCEMLCGMRWEWLRSLCYEFLRGQLCIYCLAIFTDYKTFKATTFKHVIYFYSNLSKSYCGTERFNRYHFDKHIYIILFKFWNGAFFQINFDIYVFLSEKRENLKYQPKTIMQIKMFSAR